MSTKADILLGDNLELKSNFTRFSSETGNRASVSVASSMDGSGLIIVHGGDAASDTNGLMVADEKGMPMVLIGKHSGSTVSSTKARTRFFVDGTSGNMILGGGGQDGDLLLRNHQGEVTAHISGQVGRDANGLGYYPYSSAKMRFDAGLGTYEFGGLAGGQLKVKNNAGTVKITLNGHTGKGDFIDLEIGEGTRRISSLLNKIEELENRISQLGG